MPALVDDVAYLVAFVAGEPIGYLLGLFILFGVILVVRDVLAARND